MFGSTSFRRPATALRLLLAFACTQVPGLALAGDVRVDAPAVVRERPEPLAPVVAVVSAQAFVFAGATEGSWVRVTTRDGRVGYVPGRVQATVLSPDESLAIPAALPASLALPVGGDLRVSPAAGARVASTLPPGIVVTVVSRLGDWLQVTAGPARGWVDVVVTPVALGVAAPPASAPETAPAIAGTGDEDAKKAERLRREAEQRAAAEAERQAKEEAARLEKADAEARQQAAKQAKAEKDAAEKAERERREAEKRAARDEKPVAPEAPASTAADAAAADKKAQAEAEKQAREAAAAEKKAQAEAERQAREAAAAEKKAQAAAEKKAEAAAAAEKTAKAEPEKQDRDAAAAEKKAQAEAEKQAREAAAAEKKAQAEAEKREREAAEAEKKAKADEPKQAKQSERAAREEAERAEIARLEEVRRQAEEAARARPPQPVDIPPAVAVTLAKDAPAERRRAPDENPLVREGIPALAPAAPAAPAPSGASGHSPYSAEAQVERSVSALHEDRATALGLSTGEASPSSGAGSVYVGEDARPVATRVVSQIVARVNDEILTNAEFERRSSEMLDEARRSGSSDLGPEAVKEMKRRLLGRVIEQLLLVEEGKALGIPFDKVYEGAKQRFMKQAGIQDDLELVHILDATGRTWDDFRRELLRESVPPAVLQNQVFRHVTVAEDEVAAYYRMHQEDFGEEACVLLREIVLQPEPRERTRDFNMRLEALLKSLESGADFCEMARRYSKAASADDCGRLPTCFTRGQLDEKVALVAFRMSPGDVEPITTDWGFHVIRLEESRPRRSRPMADVRDQIVERLRSERAAEQVRRYIERLKEAAKIEVAPEYSGLVADARTGGSGQ